MYSVCKLFQELRNTSMGISSEKIVPPDFLNEHPLFNDALELTQGISCSFHEELEAWRHCSLSYVQRWVFLLMEQCCGPLALDMIAGQHCALSCHLVYRPQAVYMDPAIPFWNPYAVHYDMPSIR
jgi:protein maelstrom